MTFTQAQKQVQLPESRVSKANLTVWDEGFEGLLRAMIAYAGLISIRDAVANLINQLAEATLDHKALSLQWEGNFGYGSSRMMS
uniref:Uncharacterized protein n=1 Tax=Bionectria ochroleuca TaxID=29856 RepID=A0A0B7KF28_BIOOC